jgi:phosphoesterase RecJ-like protein
VEQAERSFNIDHHRSNPLDVCRVCEVQPTVSSASEVLYYLMDAEKVSKDTAECIYLGIAHDTGVFRFSCTGPKTLEAVGALIALGVDFSRIINETYYCRTFNQTKVTGYVMEHASLALDGKVVYGYLTPQIMEQFQVSTLEMDGIIDALREVQGTEVAIFMFPVKDGNKVSMRSQYVVDVSAICQQFGGGGHARAAGFTLDQEPEEIVKQLLPLIQAQL